MAVNRIFCAKTIAEFIKFSVNYSRSTLLRSVMPKTPVTPSKNCSTKKEGGEESDEDSPSKLPSLFDRFVLSFNKATADIGKEGKKQILSSISMEGIAEYIKDKAKNIIVMCGAGISTSAGVPDFRTPGTGLYDNLAEYNLPYPMAVFDLEFFKTKPEPFFLLAKKLFTKSLKPTYCHYFIRLLHEKGLLLRLFTQNIDLLENVAGISADKVVTAHGSHCTSTCLSCGQKYDLKWISDKIYDEKCVVAYCDKCHGIVKPDIVFFGEDLPQKFYRCLITDFPKCDLLLIMGTSLTVHPFASLVHEVGNDVPRLLINLTEAGKQDASLNMMYSFGYRLAYGEDGNYRDVFWKGTCDDGVKRLAELLNWKDELYSLVEKEWKKINEENTKHAEAKK